MSEKTKQKITDWITVVLVLVLAFTAGAAFMWQYTLHNYTVAKTASEEFTPQVAETPEEPLTVEKMITTEAKNAGVDPELALAVAKLETAHFTSDAYVSGNNVGGLSDNEVPRSYATLDEGVNAFIGCLKEYFDAGLTTPEEIGRYYCPVNSSWAEVVNELM